MRTGTGCAAGQTVNTGDACTFSKDGFTCSGALCTNAVWNVTSYTESQCMSLGCAFDDLSVTGTTPNGNGCVAGGFVTGQCNFEKGGHTCPSFTCDPQLGWVNSDTGAASTQAAAACQPNGCNYADLSLDSAATANENFCTGGVCQPLFICCVILSK